MRELLICWATIMLGALCPFIVFGLVIEGVYRLIFRLLDKRSGRALWRVSSLLGTPAHEAGHALMCLLFAHRIEGVRLLPTRQGNAMVQHSYNKRNPYAVLGNLFIGLGPVFLILALIYGVLRGTFPHAMQTYRAALSEAVAVGVSGNEIRAYMFAFFKGLFTEQTRALWVRVVALLVLLCLAPHVRLSTADVRSMCLGLPLFCLLAALVSLGVTLSGPTVVQAVQGMMLQAVTVCCALLALVLAIVVIQLFAALVFRLIGTALRRIFR